MKDQIVLITGASRGIGNAILRYFAEQGSVVIGTVRKEDDAQKINQYLQQNNFRGASKILEITDFNNFEAFFDQIKNEFGDVNVLINNAGITNDGLLMKMKEDQWNDVINTNLTSAFHICKAAIKPMMKNRFGRIINIASVVGLAGNAGQCNYAAAKAGMIGFTKSLAREVASRGITVNAIAPGFIQTDMTDKLTENQKTALLNQIPANRLGSGEDIAQAAYFLSTAGYITGETINVNGGMYMA